MTKVRPPILRTPQEGRTIAVVGDLYRFLATGDETNGKYAMLEAIVPPGGGPPPHTHSREVESFFILEGEITFTVGETRFYGLLIDDPADIQIGYDTLLIATGRDVREIKAKLKPAPASAGGELFWSEPIAVKSSGNQNTKSYFRLFDLKPDGSDFFLYYTRPARDLRPSAGSPKCTFRRTR